MSATVVSIDIEPGGIDQPVGFIGLAEVDAAGVGAVQLHRFMRPDIGYSWDDWCAAQRVEAWKVWMARKSDQVEPPLHGAFTPDELAELVDMSESFMPEHTRARPPSLREVWSTLEPRLREGYTAAYGARFDRAQLRRLLDLAAIQQPNLRWLDGMEAIRHLTPQEWGVPGTDTDLELSMEAFTAGGNTLDAQVVRYGLVDPTTASRRWSLHVGLGVGNKATSFDAAEDARLNAVIFSRVIAEHGSIEAAIKALGLHVKSHNKVTSQRGGQE